MRISALCEKICTWVKAQVDKSGARGAVFGLSGGLDSSVVAAVCKRALGEDNLALIMPCHNNSEDEKHAHQVAKVFDLKAKTVPLDGVYDTFVSILPSGNKMSLANIKPRLRMITLYYFANNLDYLVVGTGNKSEIMVGYFTKHGDGGADIFPLGGLLKTQVRQLAEYLKVPREIVERVPTAGLWAGQTDEQEMGISYAELDEVIQFLQGEKQKTEVPDKKIKKVKHLIKTSKHKRKSPPIFKF